MTIDELKSITQGQILYCHLGYFVFEEILPLPEQYKHEEYFITEKNINSYFPTKSGEKVGDRYKYMIKATRYFDLRFKPLKKPTIWEMEHWYLYVVEKKIFEKEIKAAQEKIDKLNSFINQFNAI